MSKVIGDIKWELQKGYPELSGSNGDEKITVKYVANAMALSEFLPSYGDLFNSKDDFFSRFNYLTLQERQIKADTVYMVTLVYGALGGGGGSDESVVIREVEYNTADIEIPLEQLDNYQVYWNHVLLARNGISKLPTWHKTAKNKEMTAIDSVNYMWAKPNDKVPVGYYCICAEGKPGVEAALRGVVSVNETQRSTSHNYLERTAAKDYSIQRPPETFGRKGEWLRGGSQMRKNGKYWELTVPYKNSKKWDNELYETEFSTNSNE